METISRREYIKFRIDEIQGRINALLDEIKKLDSIKDYQLIFEKNIEIRKLMFGRDELINIIDIQ